MRNIKLATKIKALALTVAMSLSAFSMNVSAAEPADEVSEPTIIITEIGDDVLTDVDIASVNQEYLVNRSGTINPHESISGTFRISNFFGSDFVVLAGARTVSGNGGTVKFSVGSSLFPVPCDQSAAVICRQYDWPMGNHSYYLENQSDELIAYSLRIYIP